MMDVITEKSGHVMTPLAVSVCLTPAAPAPLPIPYPVIGNTSDGVNDSALRTKINGSAVVTVGSVLKACHGNEAGTLKEVVSLNTGGPCFIIMGAPVVLCELGMMGITGSPGFLNKAITVGMNGTASNAGGGGGGGGGGGSDGTGDGKDKGPDNPEGGGGSGGSGSGDGGAHDAPTEAERKLAAEEGTTPEHIAARKKVAEEFYKKEGLKRDFTDGPPGKMVKMGDSDNIPSHMKGIDFNKPVKVTESPPPDKIYQYQADGKQKPPGQYGSPDKHQLPDQSGIGDKGVTDKGKLDDKLRTEYDVAPGTKMLNSTAKPIDDDWSVTATGRNSTKDAPGGLVQPTNGGGNQYYIPNSDALTMKEGSQTPLAVTKKGG